jgi:rusticyanin
MRHLRSVLGSAEHELLSRGSVVAAALLLVAVATVSAQRAPAPGLLKGISTHAKTFASEADFPPLGGKPTIDAGANRITLRAPDSSLTVLAGPEGNMMSFKIAGLTNPEIVVHEGATVRFTIINVDDDMNHDFKVSSKAPPYPDDPSLGADAAGTVSMRPHEDQKPFNATELVMQAARTGQGYYLCTVHGHAKAGMFGKLTVAQ